MANVLLTILIPTLLAILAALIATYRQPCERLTSGVQHFAAGLVIAAVAEELVPEMTSGHTIAMVLGFLLGVGLMLGIKVMARKAEKMSVKGKVGTSGTMLLLAVGIDLSVDGLLLGLAVGQGLLKSIGLIAALTLEIGFLVLSTTTTLLSRGSSTRSTLFKSIGVAMFFPVFAFCGYLFLSGLSGSALVATISFAVAALLYLVVEELLVEAHKGEDTPWVTALFFLGFLVIFTI